jgi:hypothetical protein
MPVRLWLALFAPLICAGQTPKTGRIEVQAFDFIGRPLRNISVDLAALGRQAGPAVEFQGAVAERVPYGTYKIRVGAPAYAAVERDIRLNQAELAVRVELPLPMEGHDYASVSGSIKPVPRGRKLWVKVVPLYGTGGSEALVRPDGSFRVAGLDEGSYVLVVLDGESILHTETLTRVSGDRSVSITLGR